MHPIQTKMVTDGTNRVVAVQIDYADWLEVARLLGLGGSAASAAGSNGNGTVVDLNRFAGTLSLSEDPMDYQSRIRGEWS